MDFIWDDNKAKTNSKKHGITFEEAQSCFFDPLHIVINDLDHSNETEERMVLIGVSSEAKTLVVVHIEVEEEELVRIISARKATRREKTQYEEIP